MPNRLVLAGSALLAAAAALMPGTASAAGDLVVYCVVQEEWCRAMVNAFQRETGINVAMTRRSSGETYAQVKAEASNPRGDIWWGGTGDPHLQAAEEGLTIDYRSPNLDQLQPWAVRQWEQSKHRTVGVYAEVRQTRRLSAVTGWTGRRSGRSNSCIFTRSRYFPPSMTRVVI